MYHIGGRRGHLGGNRNRERDFAPQCCCHCGVASPRDPQSFRLCRSSSDGGPTTPRVKRNTLLDGTEELVLVVGSVDLALNGGWAVGCKQ